MTRDLPIGTLQDFTHVHMFSWTAHWPAFQDHPPDDALCSCGLTYATVRRETGDSTWPSES